jgi:non-lysosomal glucosylceramidase
MVTPRIPDDCNRREFLAASTATGLAFLAGPFDLQDGFPIPVDKKLDPAWLRSLTVRGEPEVYSGEELRFIGLPVGGLFAGTLYLGGDGKLWNWDIFNEHHEGCVPRERVEYRGASLRERDGANYVDPPTQRSPFQFGVVWSAGDERRPMDASGWDDVRFRGEYPVGTVEYADPSSPVEVQLEAFSPFIPLDVERSSYPATVLRYTLRNQGDRSVEGKITAEFENPVLVNSGAKVAPVHLACEERSGDDFTALLCHAEEIAEGDASKEEPRPDLPFENFESGTYEGWESSGTAFGEAPRHLGDIADYQGDLNAEGEQLVNSHQTRHGEDVRAGDQHTGTLTSRPFEVVRRFINFRIGGGAHEGRTCMNLLIDGQVVRSATGRNRNQMHFDSFDVAELEGRTARLEIVDAEEGGWGNVGIDDISFSDSPRRDTELGKLPDFGSFCVALDGSGEFFKVETSAEGLSTIGRFVRLEPGESLTIHFLVAWHFPNLQIPGFPGQRRWYASRWRDALAVVRDLRAGLDELTELTLRWRDTWYDSSLPYWLLDRTFIPTAALATNTCHRFADGRYWFWEGVGCCAGTCTHVWGYAQAIGRLFPSIERYLREEIDFGRAFHEKSGAIDYRAEFGRSVAHDGQAGCILRAWREHRMSPDASFLQRTWPRIKRAVEFLIGEDEDRDGLLEGAQYNTLDAAWYGPMGWLSSLYLAAVAAGKEMAVEMGDRDFARQCRVILDRGSEGMVRALFNGEYFIHQPDPEHPEANSTNDGCHIDQVYGQAWAHQVGLGRIIPEAETVSALRSLWKYNFAPDVGIYRDWMKVINGGRWYAVHGEAGLLMCTFPRGGAESAVGKGNSAWAAMYMNECMTGFEQQVAAHMIREGLVEEGLAITRSVHDRYHPSRRNPYNEIECSDHYGRAMSVYGVFLSACGWAYHGPSGILEVAPRIASADFRAAFTAAEGWGTIGQERREEVQRNWLAVRHGVVRLREWIVEPMGAEEPTSVQVSLRSGRLDFAWSFAAGRLTVRFAGGLRVETGEILQLHLA